MVFYVVCVCDVLCQVCDGPWRARVRACVYMCVSLMFSVVCAMFSVISVNMSVMCV